MTPLLGFSPDLDPMVPGVLTDCAMAIPFEAGLKGAPAAADVGVTALAAACRGSAVVSDLSGSRRFLAGTSTKIYEWDGSTWNDRSRATSYTLGAEERWSLIPFGNSTIAATPSAKIQRSTGSGVAFADIAAAPQAKFVEQALGFVLAFATSDAVYGSSPDRWWCSALNDETDWTPAISTQCTTGRLVGGAGPLLATERFGDDIVAYKLRSVFVGRYAGAPSVWDWRQVSNDVGCVGQDAVVETLIGHIFVGSDNVYVYDGTTPRPLDGSVAIRNWLFADMNPDYRFKTSLIWDRINYTVSIHYCSSTSTTLDACVVYHVLTRQWGRANRAIEAAVSYVSPVLTFAGGTTAAYTYNAGPSVPFDSPFWVAGAQVSAVFNTSHVVQSLSGACVSSSITTGDVGDESGYTSCDKVRVRYAQAPTTSTATGYTRDEEGVALVASQSTAQTDGRHDMRQRARFHRFRVAQTGDWKASAVRADLKPAGSR
jgi:hypothetical protein